MLKTARHVAGPSNDHFPLDLSYIGFLIILPCLLCLYLVGHGMSENCL